MSEPAVITPQPPGVPPTPRPPDPSLPLPDPQTPPTEPDPLPPSPDLPQPDPLPGNEPAPAY